MEGPSAAGAAPVWVKQCLTGANCLRGANTTCHYRPGGHKARGGKLLGEETLTHIHTLTVRGQMEVRSQSTHQHVCVCVCVGKLTNSGTDMHTLQGRRGEFISVLRPLHTKRLASHSDPSLFSYDNAVSRRYRLCSGVWGESLNRGSELSNWEKLCGQPAASDFICCAFWDA